MDTNIKSKLVFVLVISLFMIYSVTLEGATFTDTLPTIDNQEVPIDEETSNINIEVTIEDSKSSKEKCLERGCYKDNKCYSFGYIKDGKFCAMNYIVRFKDGGERYTISSIFINQSDTGESCINNFECKTNICSDNICLNLTKQEKNVGLPITGLSIENKEIKNESKDCNGCLLDGYCYPINNVKNDNYCSVKQEWVEQKNNEEFCGNNFECKSNLCVDKQCINGGFLQEILSWFRRLFG